MCILHEIVLQASEDPKEANLDVDYLKKDRIKGIFSFEIRKVRHTIETIIVDHIIVHDQRLSITDT